MKRKRYSVEQIVAAVKQHELGTPAADIALKLLQPFSFVTAQTGPYALVSLVLPDPATQRLIGTADLRRDRLDRRPLRVMLFLILQNQANGSLSYFLRVSFQSVHCSILSKNRASRKPGAAHSSVRTRNKSLFVV
jgi:hypothetical protein